MAMQFTIDVSKEIVEALSKKAEMHHTSVEKEIELALAHSAEELKDPAYEIEKYMFNGGGAGKDHDKYLYGKP